MTTRKTVLVAGATGALGRHVCELAAEAGFRVRALGRDAASLKQVSGAHERIVADALVPRELDGVMDDVTHVFSCLGASVLPTPGSGRASYRHVDTPANCNLVDAARDAGVDKFVYVSVGVPDTLGDLEYVSAHEKVVEHLRSSGMAYAVLRPTGFFSAFASVFEMASKGPLPGMGDPEAKTNPIDDAELAAFGVRALTEDVGERKLGGPEILSRQQIGELAFAALGKSARFRHMPAWVVRSVATLVRPFNARMADITRFYLAASSHDCVAPAHGERKIGAYFEQLARKT